MRDGNESKGVNVWVKVWHALSPGASVARESFSVLTGT